MDWIERTLHVSPDGGNGFTEILILLVLAFGVAAAVMSRMRYRRRLPALGRWRRLGRLRR
jgi:hypothetical protein